MAQGTGALSLQLTIIPRRLPNDAMILQTKNLSELLHDRKNSFATISTIAYVAYTMAMVVPVSLSVANADNVNSTPTDVVLALNQKQSVVSMIDKKADVTPGESKIQKEEREARQKAEAEAQVQAQAAAATLAASQSSRKVVSTTVRTYSDPANFDSIYQRAQAAYGVDWRLLKAVHYVETGCSGSTSKANPSGAKGPMQFIPSTWRAYGVDGNGDGVADITNVEDAIFAAARYLSACGYPNIQKALWGYNPSSAYYNKVMDVARSLGL